jgi:hypothetical protein
MTDVIEIQMGEMLSEADIRKAVDILSEGPDGKRVLDRMEDEIVAPNLSRINQLTKQENHPRIVAAYLITAMIEEVAKMDEEVKDPVEPLPESGK